MKNEKGITLIALAVMIVVLLIIAGVGIGASSGSRSQIKMSKSNIATAELSQIQQIVLETYVKSEQTHNSNYLIGTVISYSEAESALAEIDTGLSLTINSAEDATGEKSYYRLEPNDLDELGIKEATDTYIVNYSTGEVLNITTKYTATGEALYIAK